MNRFRHKKKIAGLLLFLAAGCDQFVDVSPPTDQLSAAYVFSSDATATATVLAIYNRLATSQEFFSDLAFSMYPGLLADELSTTVTSSSRDEFRNNNLSTTNGLVLNNFWRRGYELVYYTNSCIQGLLRTTAVTDSLKRQLLGEARLMRAFMYYHLTALFGPVPLVVGTDFETNQFLPRTAVEEIYTLMVDDITEAMKWLPAWQSTAVKSRPTKDAAAILLSRVYLRLSRPEKAAALLNDVIGSEHYRLETNLQQVFRTNGNEAIWQLGSTIPVQQAITYVPATETSRPSFIVTTSLLKAFETGDLRKTQWLQTSTIGGTTYYYPAKYRIRTSVNNTESITIFRLADAYLLRAELAARLSKTAAATADLNVVRERAGLPPLPAGLTVAELYAAVEQERRIELMFEWGNRWFDLKRTGRADPVLSKEKGTYWQPADTLLPIPSEEIRRNPGLIQNDGYS